MVSNYPEKIQFPGLIFDKPFDKSWFRILYHHRNVSLKGLSVVISLQNLSLHEERVSIRAGLGGSTEDVIFAGHKAAQSFLAQYLSKPKTIVLPPASSTSILVHSIKPSQTSSGIIQIDRHLDSDLRVRMGVVDPIYSHLSLFRDISSVINQYRVAHFDDRVREKHVSFDSAHHITSVEVGGSPYLVDSHLNYQLMGNYGVLYHFNIQLSNSLDHLKQINFYLAPKKDNAIDRAVFLIDGHLKEVGVSFTKDDNLSMRRFYSILLKPGDTKDISLITLPQSGCYYPVDVIIRSMDSLL